MVEDLRSKHNHLVRKISEGVKVTGGVGTSESRSQRVESTGRQQA
jgi:hypothetical protein